MWYIKSLRLDGVCGISVFYNVPASLQTLHIDEVAVILHFEIASPILTPCAMIG